MEMKTYTVKRDHLGFDFAHDGEGKADKMFETGSIRMMPAHTAKPLVDTGTLEPALEEKAEPAPKNKKAPAPKNKADAPAAVAGESEGGAGTSTENGADQ